MNKKRKTKKKKTGIIKKILLILLSIILLLIIACFISFFSWKSNLISSLENGSQIIQTSVGQVEYAKMGKGPVILISHGGATGYDNIYMYKDLVDEGFTLVCPSRPGYLRTPLDVGPAFEEQADMMAALLDALKIKEKVFMLGISLGGPTALQFALRYPNRCKGLIMQDAVSKKYLPIQKAKDSFWGKLFLSKFGSDLSGWIQYLSVKYAPASVFDEYLQIETFYDKDKTKQLAEEIMKDPKEVEKLKALINMISPMSKRKTGLDSEMEYAAKIPRYPLEKIKIPTLVTQSKVDRNVEFDNGEFIAKTVPKAEFYSFDGLGHLFWFGNEWQTIYSKMVSFLKKHSKPITVIKNKFLFETTWVSNMDGAMLTINSNGTFTIDFPSIESTASIKGTYEIEGNKIIFLYKPDSDICDGIEGTYRINLKDNILEFLLISDKCKSRKKHFKEEWFGL